MIIAITNRKLCPGELPARLEELARSGVSRIILREKDLDLAAYLALYRACAPVCAASRIPLAVNHSPEAILGTGTRHAHLPEAQFAALARIPGPILSQEIQFGVSVHSVESAMQAENRGAAYLVAGHIYDTACKAGLTGRGTAFLRQICEAVSIPVFAVGGITPENAGDVYGAGAAGICLMSSLMEGGDPSQLIDQYKKEKTS